MATAAETREYMNDVENLGHGDFGTFFSKLMAALESDDPVEVDRAKKLVTLLWERAGDEPAPDARAKRAGLRPMTRDEQRLFERTMPAAFRGRGTTKASFEGRGTIVMPARMLSNAEAAARADELAKEWGFR